MRAENLLVDPECVKDPTLQRRQDVECKHCGHNEAVSYTQPTKDRMTLIFVCTRCTQYWTKGEGQQDDHEIFSDDSAQWAGYLTIKNLIDKHDFDHVVLAN